jgi:hypothetical protein
MGSRRVKAMSKTKKKAPKVPRNHAAYDMIMSGIGKNAAGPMRDRRNRRPFDARKSWRNEDWGS